MIRKYNLSQTVMGIACIPAGMIGYACAWLFFRHLPGYALRCFGFHPGTDWLNLAAALILVAISASGYRLWRNGGGFSSYHESGLYHNLDPVSGGGLAMDFYAHRVTGPAFLLGQLFLAGPLMILRALQHFKNRIAPDESLENSLRETLTLLQSINKWQSLSDHPGRERDILVLAKIGRIDFSTARGPRFKAGPEGEF